MTGWIAREAKDLPKKLELMSADLIKFAGHDKDGDANQDGDGDSRPTFSMVAYTGGAMSVPMWEYPVIVDLKGLTIPSQTRPIRFQHSERAGVGHSTRIEISKGNILVEGIISRATSEAHEIIESAKQGFPWQASIGVVPDDVEYIDNDIKVTVNNQSQRGPLYVLRASHLGEISFVDLGADDRTSVTVRASEQENGMKEKEKKGSEAPESQVPITTETSVSQEVSKDVNSPVQAAPKNPPVEASAKADGGAKADPKMPVVEASAEMSVVEGRKVYADEIRRLKDIKVACKGDEDIHAQAIECGWNSDRTELEVLRKSRPVTNVPHTPIGDRNMGQILECAGMVAGGLEDVEGLYSDEVLQAAHKRFRQGVGLQEMLLEAAWANGFEGRKFEGGREVMEFAFNRHAVQGAFSSVDIAGILSNVANKFLLEGFRSVEGVWREVSSRRSVKDFKQVSSYRLVGTEQYEKVGPGGEIKHGDLDEQKFTNQADTYGLMLALTRTDLINDDLGALTGVTRKLGRGSGLKINDVFWTEFLANTGHFKTANNNFIDGAASNLSIDSLTIAEQKFMDQTDTEGKPLGLMPALLLVPTSLSAISASLFRSTEIRDTTASTKIPVGNPHSGKYSPIISAYLGNTAYTGNSQKAWYLLGNSADMSTIEIAFLNGQESPTIETADANFNVLGIQMRGFHDFGVKLQDPRGGVKTKGEA